MYKHQINAINQDILRTKRAIIALGCSFVQGGGAINEKIYRNYKWESSYDIGPGPQWRLTDAEKKEIIDEFPDVELLPERGELRFTTHEMNNSFVNVLAKKYFNGDYAGINLGRSGNGNRATIKDLYFYPDILWNEIKEKIVIFCPSGMERFDYIDDMYFTVNDHGRWITMWPNLHGREGLMKNLWELYKDGMYSEKFEIAEAVATVQELILWCKYNNAKLIITSAFSTKYTKQYFLDALGKSIERDFDRSLISISENSIVTNDAMTLCDMWPWDNMFYPDGELTFADLVTKQECKKGDLIPNVYSFLHTGSPNFWVSPCAHPGAKGHDLFAQHLHNYIEKTL